MGYHFFAYAVHYGGYCYSARKISMVTAIPVVLGSILRIPLGYYANIFGARIVFLVSFILLLFPVYYISEASTMTDLIIGGLFLGIGGAVFSVGVTSLPKYYPKEKHGFVNGMYGIGNLGTAVTTFSALLWLPKSAGTYSEAVSHSAACFYRFEFLLWGSS